MLCLSMYFPCSIQADLSPVLWIGAYSVISSIAGTFEWAAVSSWPRMTVTQYLPSARSSAILLLVRPRRNVWSNNDGSFANLRVNSHVFAFSPAVDALQSRVEFRKTRHFNFARHIPGVSSSVADTRVTKCEDPFPRGLLAVACSPTIRTHPRLNSALSTNQVLKKRPPLSPQRDF
jgi:hypothetical protein